MLIDKFIDKLPIQSEGIKMTIGILLTVILISILFSLAVNLLGMHSRSLVVLGAAFGATGGLLFAARYGNRKKLNKDERFQVHRANATRLAAVVGIMIMAAWLIRDYVAVGKVRWDFIVILGAMALSKGLAMAYYQIRN
ncbi:MAG TPA: hypothetical protein VGB38_08355 [bacterium]